MTKLNLILTLSFVVGLLSCSSDEFSHNYSQEKDADNNMISIMDASRLAVENYEMVFGTTRSACPDISNVEMFGNFESTRNSKSSELYGYYIINFGNCEGFAIVSADKRRDVSVFAISDEANLNLTDTVDNIGIRWYLNDYLGKIGNIDNEIKLDTTIHDIIIPNLPVKTVYCERLLSGFLSQFGQDAPFNKYCFTKSGEQAVVGCMPLATGTVMSLDEWPTTYEEYSFDWGEMKSNYYSDSWARIFEIIGRPKNENVNYGVTSTSASSSTLKRTFKNLGYEGTSIDDFSISTVTGELRKSRAVIMLGQNTSGSSGHAWVVDGGYSIYYDNTIAVEPQTDYYLHCVWGWYGTGNGYFYYRNNSLGGKPYSSDDGSDISVYTYNALKVVYGYTPKK